jgi:hypothetical protein
MAWQVSKRVWDSIKTEGDKKKGVDASERLMLLALADKADENGICWPKHDTSYQTLGDMVGVNRRSAMRLADNLAKAGHIWKSETAGRGHSNIFIVTIGLSEAETKERLALIGVTDDTNTNEGKVLPEAPIIEPEKEMVLPVTQNGVMDDTNKGLNGVTGNTQSNKSPSNPSLSPKGDGDEKKPKQVKTPPLESETMFVTLAKICQYNLKVISEDTKGMIGQTAKILIKAGLNPDDLAAFESWWYDNDWRGKKKEAPKPHQIRETLGQFQSFQGRQKAARPRSLPDSPEPEKPDLTPEERILALFKERAAAAMPTVWKEHVAPMRLAGCENGKIQIEVSRPTKELIENRYNRVLDPIAQELSPGGFEYVVI